MTETVSTYSDIKTPEVTWEDLGKAQHELEKIKAETNKKILQEYRIVVNKKNYKVLIEKYPELKDVFMLRKYIKKQFLIDLDVLKPKMRFFEPIPSRTISSFVYSTIYNNPGVD